MGKLSHVEEKIGYYFDDQMLLRRALTHPSVATHGDAKPFERLEFLGDRVLGVIVADLLYHQFPDEWEGEMARRFSFLVRKEMLLEVAEDMGLKDAMLLPGEKGTGIQKHYDTIWADGCEALLGALYLDGGMDVARNIITHYWTPKMKASTEPPIDPKNALQEWSQGEGYSLPLYTFISQTGPDHAPEFIMEASLAIKNGETIVSRGSGPSKKAAEKKAAAGLLAKLMDVVS